LYEPQNVALDSSGNLYVSCYGGYISTVNAVTRTISILVPATVYGNPVGIAVDAGGLIYWTPYAPVGYVCYSTSGGSVTCPWSGGESYAASLFYSGASVYYPAATGSYVYSVPAFTSSCFVPYSLPAGASMGTCPTTLAVGASCSIVCPSGYALRPLGVACPLDFDLKQRRTWRGTAACRNMPWYVCDFARGAAAILSPTELLALPSLHPCCLPQRLTSRCQWSSALRSRMPTSSQSLQHHGCILNLNECCVIGASVHAATEQCCSSTWAC
jgi:hypothetical protein